MAQATLRPKGPRRHTLPSPTLSGTIGLNHGHEDGWIAQKGLAGARCPPALSKGGLLMLDESEARSFFDAVTGWR